MHRRGRHYFTLVEVLIAMTLTLLAMTTLAYVLRQVDQIDRQIEGKQQLIFVLRYAEGRLAMTLPRTSEPPHSNNQKKSPFFFASGSSSGVPYTEGSDYLLFTYRSEENAGSDFGGTVLARLFVDDSGTLTLAQWPHWQHWSDDRPPPLHLERLMDNVAKMQFLFFVPPELETEKSFMTQSLPRSGFEMEPLPESDDWLQEWKTEYFRLPALVKIILTIKGKEDPETFIFPLLNSDMPIVYTGGK